MYKLLHKLWLTITLFALLAAAPSLAAATDNPLGAPNATFLIEADVLGGNQSNNLGPAAQWVLDNFWEAGPCPAGDSYEYCDILRFGAATYSDADCLPGVELQVVPHEDGADPVGEFLTSNETSTLCGQPQIRPLADGLLDLQKLTFPGLSSANGDVKDQWFDHPHLTLAVISAMPQDDEENNGAQVRRSLQAACKVSAGVPSQVPPMLVWAMVARLHDDDAVDFAHLLAAAGGTGQCCDTFDKPDCDPRDENQQIAVCAETALHPEGYLRDDIANGRYRCVNASDTWQTGALDFESTGNNLPQITCHLHGQGPGTGNNPNVCDQAGRQATDLFGKFACIRQLPRHMVGTTDELQFCDHSGCTTLSESAGDFEFIDDSNTLIAVADQYCEALASGTATIEPDPCPMQGLPCDTGNLGRCAPGVLDCDDAGNVVCHQLHQPMPEICNGLDDSCDGKVDNTWDTLDQLPSEHHPRACHGEAICGCPDGPERAYYGHDIQSFVDGHEGLCRCIAPASENHLSTSNTAEGPGNIDPHSSPSISGCSQSSQSSGTTILMILALVFLTAVIRHL